LRMVNNSSGSGASPSDLLETGDRFLGWYPGQRDLLLECLSWYYSPDQFLGVSAATGVGKSLLGLLLSKLTNTRTMILTATKGLSHQYLADAKDIGGVEVKGRNNFRCLLSPDFTAEDGVCNLGIACDLRDQCPYRLQLEAARKSSLVITNYAYWLAQTNYTDEGLGSTGLLICDEAHMAFSSLEGFLTVFISHADIHPLGITFPVVEPDQRQQGWRVWAESAREVASTEASRLGSEVRSVRHDKSIPPAPLVRAARRANGLVSKLGLLSGINEQWVVQWTQSGCRFVPKWVAHHSEDLFHTAEVPKIILMSAILSRRTADYLGVPEDCYWVEADSYFPAENTQIWHIPTARINYRTGDMETRLWVSRIDQIIQRRLDRKGIVFTVSYERARLLLSRSRFKDIMLSHSTGDVVQVVEQFKKAPPPVVLVSPSVTTGYDFPQGDGLPQYLVVGKLPYPDTSEPVTKARHEEDKDWTSYQAMETLIQESGRISRSAGDRAEVFVLDDNIRWFMRVYGQFAPAWFRERYRGTMDTVPNPLV